MAEDAIVDSVICLECPEDECERRIIERAKTSGRSDDNLVNRLSFSIPMYEPFDPPSPRNSLILFALL